MSETKHIETKQRRYQTSEQGRIKQQEARERYTAFRLLSSYMGDEITEWVESQREGKETKLATVARLLNELKTLRMTEYKKI